MWFNVLIGFYVVAIVCLFFCRRPIAFTIIAVGLIAGLLGAVLKLAGGAA